MDVWILFGMIAIAMLVTVYLAMRFGRGHRGHNKSTQRYLDEVEQPKRFWF